MLNFYFNHFEITRQEDYMKYMIDSSNIEALKRIYSFGLTQGVTTNPSILAQVQENRFKQYLDIRSVSDGDLFVQLVGDNVDSMFEDYVLVSKFLKENQISYVIKVPINEMGLEVIRKIRLIHETERFLGTTIYTFHQAVLAIHAGCDYLAPYYNRIVVEGEDPNVVIENIRNYIDAFNYNCVILAASLKTPHQVSDALNHGAHTCTVSPELFFELMHDNRVDRDVKKFNEDDASLPK